MPKSPPQRLARGTTIGKYRLAAKLGQGGFSEVWKAKDLVEDRWVALKLPTPVKTKSDEEDELLREIRLGATLEHDAILKVRNADKVDGRYVIASDLAKETLEERLSRRMGTRLVIDYTHRVLKGLAHAHAHRIIHRDLKPSNLMIFEDGGIRIADFGLAKVSKHTMISATGSGTLLYVAPEQAHGYPCFASDVFSLGLVIHQMIAGTLPRWPFKWPFDNSAIIRSKTTPAFVDMLRRATDPNHAMRYRDAEVMLAEFEVLLPALLRRVGGGGRKSKVISSRRKKPAWRAA